MSNEWMDPMVMVKWVRKRLDNLWYELSHTGVFHKVSRVKWFILHRYHPSHRYHIVRTSLKPGYHDPDLRILSVMFDVTEEFLAENHTDWNYNEYFQKVHSDLSRAVQYWKTHKEDIQHDRIWKDDDLDELKAHLDLITENIKCMWY